MSSNLTPNERLAVVETELENLRTTQTQILALLSKIDGELTRYKGFLGGIVFLVSCLWAAIAVFKAEILHWK